MQRDLMVRARPGRGMTLLAAALLLVGGALAAGSGFLRPPTVVPPVPEPSVIAVASGSTKVATPGPSASAAPSASPIPVAGPGGVWIRTGSMTTPRSGHSAVQLLDGRVLVVGNRGRQQPLTSTELYDPTTGTWSATGSISKPLFSVYGEAATTLLRDGKVLVQVGGFENGPRRTEVYDPDTGTWTATGPMVFPVTYGGPGEDTFTVLRDGRVLVVGRRADATERFAAQVYDPASGTWTATGKRSGEGGGQAALLSDGKVLFAGGGGYSSKRGAYALDSAEVFDPVTGSWTAIANMHAKASTRGAFLQPDGKVLVVGPASLEMYDPATGTWTALPVRLGISYDDAPTVEASLLSDGTVLVTGYVDGCVAADLYDPRTGTWTTASTMLECARGGRSLTLLRDGTVLVAGGAASCGNGGCVGNWATELYVPAGVPLPRLPAFPSPPPPAFPSPTPVPPPLPPAVGPVPPNARSWTVTVDNESSEPATLFVAEFAGMSRLVGSATPNVVPAGTTVKVTFLFPAKGNGDSGWIYVNPRPGEGGGLVSGADIGIPGKIVVTPEGDSGWLGP